MGHELVLTPLDATPLHFVGLIDISFGRRGDIKGCPTAITAPTARQALSR